MKNSLFKRAIATAAAVPLALSQCLTVADVATTQTILANAADSENSVTLNGETGLLYITPDKGISTEDGYVRDDAAGTFVKDSEWNSALLAKITSTSKKTGTIDASFIFDEILARSGNYREVTQEILDKVGEISYSVAENGDITISGTLDDVTPAFSQKASNAIGGALNELAEQYGATELADVSNIFDGVEIAGSFTLVIKGSSLDDTKVEAEFTYVDKASGKAYKGTSVIDYALEQFETLKQAARDAVNDVKDEYGIDVSSANASIDDSVSFYENKLKAAKKYIAKGQAKTTELKEYASFSDLLAAADNSRFADRIERIFKAQIPSSGAGVASNDKVLDIYGKILEQIASIAAPYTIDITAADLGAFADDLTNIKTQLNGGVATFTADFTDAEAADAETYLEGAYDVDITNVYKQISITADYSAVQNGNASVDVQIKRIAEFVPVTTTTTTTTTTDTTETSTTTTTTASTDESETTTTTTTTEGSDDSTTTTTTTTGGSDDTTTTTTTTTTDGSDDTTTTTTTTTEPPVSETTTVAVEESVTNVTMVAKTGFYLNIDDEFNPEQIESISYSIDKTVVYYGEDGEKVGEEEPVIGEYIDITDKVNYGDQTPAGVFVRGEYVFAHQIAVYAAEDIVDEDGNVVFAEGDVIKKSNGQEVSVTAYVGVKGDGDLNFKAESTDASLVLAWYAKMSTGGDPETDVFSNSDLITEVNEDGVRVPRADYDKTLDEFAAFLCDTDNEDDENNWNLLKPARKIMATDSSNILACYSKASTGREPDRAFWDEILAKGDE